MTADDLTVVNFGNYAYHGAMVPRHSVVEYAEIDPPKGQPPVRVHAVLYDAGYPPLTAITKGRVVLRLNRVCTTYCPVAQVGFYRPNSIAFLQLSDEMRAAVLQGGLAPAPPIKAATLQCGLFLADFAGGLADFNRTVYSKAGEGRVFHTPPRTAKAEATHDLGGEGGGA